MQFSDMSQIKSRDTPPCTLDLCGWGGARKSPRHAHRSAARCELATCSSDSPLPSCHRDDRWSVKPRRTVRYAKKCNKWVQKVHEIYKLRPRITWAYQLHCITFSHQTQTKPNHVVVGSSQCTTVGNSSLRSITSQTPFGAQPCQQRVYACRILLQDSRLY
jgi:hypothetical protein